VLDGLGLVGLHPVGLPEHFQSEDEHDDDGSVEGVDLGDEGGDAPAEHGGHDRHEDEGRDGAKEDGELVVPHGKNGCDIQIK